LGGGYGRYSLCFPWYSMQSLAQPAVVYS
jgi:hypothetical protein